MPTSKAQREQYRIKNERRKAAKLKSTAYAQRASTARKGIVGFGHNSASSFNKLAEGTTAVPKSEADLGSKNGSTKETNAQDKEERRSRIPIQGYEGRVRSAEAST